MDKITAASIADSKPSFTVAVEAAGALTLGAGEIGIFVGTNVRDTNNQRVVTALDDLRDAFREAQYPNGVNAFNTAAMTPPGKTGVLIANLIAMPALTEDDVLIAYETGFYPEGNSVNIGEMIKSLIELYQERILKFS